MNEHELPNGRYLSRYFFGTELSDLDLNCLWGLNKLSLGDKGLNYLKYVKLHACAYVSSVLS